MTTTTYSLISGELPPNLQLSGDGTIYGVLAPVQNITRSRFVIRETTESGISDQTFYIDVRESSDMIWNTAAGYLPVGANGEEYALNRQWVDYSLNAELLDPPLGSKIRYYLSGRNDRLPPGLLLSEDGRISGFVNDQLITDGEVSLEGGYDNEAYDQYSYDHGTSYIYIDSNLVFLGVPKIYSFSVTATDGGVNTTSSIFKIVVSDTNILNYNPSSMPDDITLPPLLPNDIYVQYPQWLHGTDLGIVRAENNDDISVEAYDPAPLVGNLVYTLVTGTSILTNLPEGLSLDSKKGYLYGFIPYQPAYTKTYSLTINATKTVGHSNTFTSVTATNVFSLTIRGAVDSEIEWVSTSSLGILKTGNISELAVKARQINSNYNIKYSLLSGILPPGLILERDGTIVGEVPYGNTGTYTFTVQANDVYELNAIVTTTNITIIEDTSTQYTSLYFRPYLSLDKRDYYKNFISNELIFDSRLMYRSLDPNFGIQRDIKMILEYNVEKVELEYFVKAMKKNFYRRNFWFGEVKSAIAKNTQGEIVYEIVYVEIIDDMVNDEKVSVSSTIYQNTQTYYPSSVDNMKEQLKLISLEDQRYIEIDDNNLPRYMKTAQEGSYLPLGYVALVPICYALPGQSSRIISRIKASDFDFKKINFEIDRLIIQKDLTSGKSKYLIFERQSLSNFIDINS